MGMEELMRVVMYLAIVSLVLMPLPVPQVSGENDQEMDALRFQVVEGPDNQLVAMQNGITDVLPDLTRTADMEKLDADGFLVTQDLGFHIGYIAYNIRDDQSYRRPGITYWPLKDAEFRHSLFHCFDQLRIVPSFLGYIATPIDSLVPPAQSKYYNPCVPRHPYNPGNPFTSPPGEHSTCGILKQKGYSFVDSDASGTVTDVDYWTMPNGDPLPYMVIWTPLEEVAPTSYQIAAEFVADLARVGLAATAVNGNFGILNLGHDFNEYLSDVYDHLDFDAFMVFNSLERLPTHLYPLLHSGGPWPWQKGNAPGIYDPVIDELCEIVKFSLDLDAVEAAAKQIQERIFDPMLPNADNFALAYMPLYSRSYFNAYNPSLRGIVRSPGYGSDNKWTFSNIRWLEGSERIEDGKKTAIRVINDELDSLSPFYQPYYDPLHSGTEDEWEILARSYDELTNINPYNHNDIPWMALDWTIRELASGMEIDFVLRDYVHWQDGTSFTAYDVEFCLEFLRDYQVPRYAETWETLIDVVVTDATHLTIQSTYAGFDLFYDYSALVAMLPEHIWNRFGEPSDPANKQAVLDYDPTEPYNVAPGYTPGPTPTPTNLVGTGPWIFQFYDAVSLYSDMWKNPNYFMSHTEMQNLMTNMFWEVGDYNKDGVVNVVDLAFASFAYGAIEGIDPEYDPDADFNSDGIVDMRDIYTTAFHLLWQREYP